MKRSNRKTRRRGVAIAVVVIGIILMLGMASMTIDIGMMYRARSEAQSSADASAMAAAWRLLDQDRLRGSSFVDAVTNETRTTADDIAGRNWIVNESPALDLNNGNATGGDIVIGRLNDPYNADEEMSFGDASQYNAVRTFVHRDTERNGPIDLFFAAVFGRHEKDISASATAAFYDGVIGWRVTGQSGNAGLLPFTLKKEVWDGLMAGTWTTGDDYTYDSSTDTVSPGPDGINELNLYPGAGDDQLPPGNFGTVDIGPPDNSTAELSRQIREGINEEDLAYFGGSLELGEDGTLLLNGDTGLSAAVKDDLAAIIGKPRAIPIFTVVEGPGNNSTFTVVGFVGIRILDVKLTGPMSGKKVMIQPAYLVDDTAIVGESSGQSRFVYRPVQLVR